MRRYAVIGAGGTGTFLLDPLVRYLSAKYPDGEWGVAVVDGDSVAPHNLERQLFSEFDIQVNKALAATRPYREKLNIVPFPDYLGEGNIDEILVDGITVFICADNYHVRARIEEHCALLRDATIINGGNEESSSSCQVYLRRNGEDLTPRLSFLHPEIKLDGDDRSTMSCVQIAALPSGGQIITANMASALWMLQALIMVEQESLFWTELHLDLKNGQSEPRDNRELRGWREPQEINVEFIAELEREEQRLEVG